MLFLLLFFFLMLPPPPRSTLFPYTTLFRSINRTFLNNLPLVNRDAYDLVFLAPGLVHTNGDKKTKSRSEEHTSELQSRFDLVCRLLLEKKKKKNNNNK